MLAIDDEVHLEEVESGVEVLVENLRLQEGYSLPLGTNQHYLALVRGWERRHRAVEDSGLARVYPNIAEVKNLGFGYYRVN